MNVDKCKLLRINSQNNDVVEVNGRGIEDGDRFVYLGVTVSKKRAKALKTSTTE